MMIKIVFLAGILFSTLFSADQIVSREGDIVTVVASGEYIMGDSDNRKEARTMALTQAKTNASEVAGTYIESNFELVTKQTNGDTVDKVTKQELRSFSAAILQSEITNDTMEMLANKTTVYKVSIKARIDLATLRERVKQLGEDKAKKDRLLGLEKENQELSSALQKLSVQMRTLENTKSVKPEEIKALRDERDRLFTKLEKNEGAIKLVFEKGSIQTEYDQKVEIAKNVYETIDDTVYKHIADFITIVFDKPKVVDEDGVRYLLKINYRWEIDNHKVIDTLKKNSIQTSDHDTDIALDSREYDETVRNLLDKRFRKDGRDICLLFSLPGIENEVRVGKMSGTDGMYRPNIFHSFSRFGYGERSSINFIVTKEQMIMMDAVEAKIGFCKKDAQVIR